MATKIFNRRQFEIYRMEKILEERLEKLEQQMETAVMLLILQEEIFKRIDICIKKINEKINKLEKEGN